MKTQITILVFLVVIAGAVSVAYVANRHSRNIITSPPVIVDRSTASDLLDDGMLVGENHVVFVGKIIKQIGNVIYPGTKPLIMQFDVKVIYNIKGNLQGNVVLGQVRGVEPLAQVGSTYLFAARYNETPGWYTFGVSEAYRLISEEASLSDADLKSLAAKDPRVVAMQNAYSNEELSPIDIRYKTTYNSYVSRHFDTSGQLIDDTVVLHEQYLAAHPSATPVANEQLSPSIIPSESVEPAATPEISPSTSPEEFIAPSPSETAAPSATPEPTAE